MKWLLSVLCLVGLSLANAPDVHAQTCVNGQCSKQANTIYLGQSLTFARERSSAGFSHGVPAQSHPQLVHGNSCDSLTRNVQYVSQLDGEPQPQQPAPVVLYPMPDPCFTPGCAPVFWQPCHCHQYRPAYQSSRKTVGIGLSLSWGGSKCYGGSCR